MTNAEKQLIGVLVKAVIAIADHLSLKIDGEGVANKIRIAAGNAQHELDTDLAGDDFKRAIARLDEAEITNSLEHTGGGIFVLYHRWGDPEEIREGDAPHVGITVDETDADLFLVVGYSQYEDPGSIIKSGVSLFDLPQVVRECAEYVNLWTRTWQLHGTVTVRQDDEQELTFTWQPAAGDAGYFGPEATDVKTGDHLAEYVSERFWNRIGNYIDPDTSEITMFWSS